MCLLASWMQEGQLLQNVSSLVVGILTAVPALTTCLWNLCNNFQPNTWFVINPTVFLYIVILYSVCVCRWGEGASGNAGNHSRPSFTMSLIQELR